MDVYRSLHPEMYFTPDHVKDYIEHEEREREASYVPDWLPVAANPPVREA